MQADRHRLQKLLRQIEHAEAAGRPFDRNLARLEDELKQSIARRQARWDHRPRIEYDDALPVSARRQEIAAAIAEHQVVVVWGETGSGKSTQLPKICLEMGRGVAGLIGHTQPRRIAARSVAARIADELGSPLGQQVGFKIRFTDTTSTQSYIKLMTDGILLAESQHDRFLDQYDTIIVDEAHERSLNIDFLLGYIKRLLPKRRELKLIITSATIDAARFAEHFGTTVGPAPVIEVSGRTYPVETRYRPLVADENDEDPDLEQGVLDAVAELTESGPGDILIFMPTEHHIHETAKALRGKLSLGHNRSGAVEIVPLYARLSTAEQNRVFQPHRGRRIVIATNVAESSLTVPGIRYVVDPGTARISRYSARSKMQRLPIEPISQASANQRQGRCGRVAPGICIRLFSEEDFQGRDRFTPPEIQRSNLASVILQTKALKLGPIEEFPFLDPPRPDAIRDGYKTLFELGAIDEEQGLTPLGQRLSRLPTDPRIGRIILAGHEENCLHEILIIAAAMEVQDPRERPVEKKGTADESHAKFAHEESDFLSYLKLWDFWQKLKGELSRGKLRKACQQNFLSYNRMREWVDVHRQLLELIEEEGMKPQARRDDYTAIHRALLAGLLSNVAFRAEAHEYTVAGGGKAHLWPGSAAFAAKPKWIVAAEQVETSRRYLRTVARIKPEWIESLAGHLVNRSYSEPHWVRAAGAVMAFEKVSLGGLAIVPRRRVAYGSIDPKLCREQLIQHGLVEGELDTRAEFFQHNRQLLEEVEALQTRARRRDLLLGEEARYDFYDRRLPADVFDAVRLEKWRRSLERKQPKLLFMRREDLMRDETAGVDAAEFPETIEMRSLRLPLEYTFDPASDQDGVTLTVPREALGQIDRQRLGWLVPGLLEEKVVALIKSLPKPLRRQFVPAPDTARKVMEQIRFGEGSFAVAVAETLSRIAGQHVPVEAFQLGELPPHLRMNVRVVDSAGTAVATSRDVGELHARLVEEARQTVSQQSDPRWQRDGITTWDFGELPAGVPIQRQGIALEAFPTLIDDKTSVRLQLVDTAENAQRLLRGGLRRLFVLAAARELKSQAAWLPSIDQMRLYAATLADAKEFPQQVAELIADRAFFTSRPLPRSADEFAAAVKLGRSRIAAATQDVAQLLGPLMKGVHEARLAVERATAPRFADAVADVREQLEWLLPAGFLLSTPAPWLVHLPRYLRAIVARLEKLTSDGLVRDQKNQQLLAPRWRRFRELAEAYRQQERFDPELEQYRWMLEEYRVSLFAQKLGTSLTVSEKRLDEQWARIQQN
jgi:ATP-dependent helicase HrpA